MPSASQQRKQGLAGRLLRSRFAAYAVQGYGPVLLAAALAYWHLMGSLPYRHPDESLFVSIALSILRGKPTSYIYGHFAPMVTDVAYAGYFVWLRCVGKVSSAKDMVAWLALYPVPFYFLPRVVSATAAVGSVWLTMRAARAYMPEGTSRFASVAALVVAVSPTVAERAHLGLPDTMLLFLSSLLLVALLAAAKRPTHSLGYGVAALVLGLAFGTKTLGIALLPIFCLVIVTSLLTQPTKLWVRAAVYVAVGGVFGLVVSQPLVFLHLRDVYRDLYTFQWQAYMQGNGAPFTSRIVALTHALVSPASGGIGPAALLALPGVIGAWHYRRHTPELAALAVGWLLGLALLAAMSLFQTNWAIVLLPAFGVLTAAGSARLWALQPGRMWAKALTIILLLGLCWPLTCAVSSVRHFGLPDTRLVAQRTIEATIPPGSSLLLADQTWTLPILQPNEASLQEQLRRIGDAERWASLREYTQGRLKALSLRSGPTYRIRELRYTWWSADEQAGQATKEVAPAPPIYDYSPRPLDEYRALGVEYVIHTDDAVSRFDSPEFPSVQAFFRELRQQGRLAIHIERPPESQGREVFVWDIRGRPLAGLAR
jgi:hypothetical protein